MTAAKTIVITGATAGVGRAAAERFAREGWRIGMIARDPLALEQTAAELRELGAEVHHVASDVADAAAMHAAADELAREFGRIDVWVNNAMLTVFSRVADITPEEYARVTEVTYLGSVYGAMGALRHMRKRGAGHIIQVGSALAYRAIPLQSAYCGAKHALRAFMESLRTELMAEKSSIKLSMIELPAINTPQFDWARAHLQYTPRPAGGVVFQPEAAANAIYRAVQHPRREYLLGFVTVKTILGAMAAPGLLDRILSRSAISGQQTHKLISPRRQDNLMQPVTALHRTHGSFGDGAKTEGLLVSGALARGIVIAAGALACMLLGAGIARALEEPR